MSAWIQIDNLRDRIAQSAPVVIDSATIESLAAGMQYLREQNYAPDRLVVLGWEILLSRRRQDGVVRWHLSTKLHPHGRSSTANDWKIVGRIAARVGAPADPAIMPDDPSAAIHWSWIER
jgi:hypothetical protein